VLSWNSEPTATSFNVYRSLTSGGPYTKVNTTPITLDSYTDTNISINNVYYYVATAVNQYGESSYSSQVSASIK